MDYVYTLLVTESALILAVFCSGSLGVTWTTTGLQTDQTLHACAGNSVSFPWAVALATGETILAVEWFYAGGSRETVAMLSHGVFVPLPSFSGRVELTANEGLVLHHVTVMDSGNYSVEFTVQQADGHLVKLRRTAVLYVVDGLPTRDGKLQVRMSTEARFDNSSQTWDTALTCGTFVFTTHPPFSVTWKLPDNSTRVSAGYEDGQFLLYLSASSPGGPYLCQVPSRPGSSCSSTQGEAVARPVEAGVVVDRSELRLLLLEARQGALVAENEKLKEQHELLVQQQQHISASSGATTQKGPRVSFHARLFTSLHLPTWSKLVLTDVLSNHGNAYSNVTGEFRAPFNGTYFFIATTAVYGADHVANFFLVVDNREVDYAYTSSWGSGHSEGGTVHALLTLTTGQRVWLRSYQNSYYLDGPTAFSGFLLYTT